MVDLITFKAQVKIIVNNLTQTLMAQIYTAAEKTTLNIQSPKAQMVEAAVDQQEETPGDQRDPSQSDVMETQIHQGANAGVEQTYILVYESAAVDPPERLPDPLQGGAQAAGEDRSTEVPGGVMTLTDSAPDHEYAQASSPPPGPPAAGEGPAAHSREQRHRRREKDTTTTQSPEIHHQCSQCRRLFPNSERLSAHRRKSHPACSVCRQQFTGVLKLREHERREHGLLPHACDFCPKRFNHTAHRNLHVKARHTGEKSCHCDVCGRGFSCVSVLKTHRVTHFDKTFICDICGKSFHHACHLTRHELVHQDERPHRCSHCGRGFTQAANLRSHQAVHTGERQLCSVCGRSYRCLKNHVISKHSHELPADQLPARDSVTCEVCGKKFPNLPQVKVHQRSHTGEKPFHCDLCGRSYRLQERLRDHRSTHSGSEPYSCSLCSKTFNMASSFLRRRSIHGGETPHSCHACGKRFRLLAFLKAHLQTKGHLRRTQQRPAPLTSDL
ncbi:zinc finger protein 45-like isoform X2 [Limanda limanda]|uniref:zinc finger protein 45-like isoform X2 n=1 Tax=Limanda limanda TaxID=27771 RepID=UPI0029C63C09|nr:zinc finger protein 45-like isoform X2 [Limanda limanda]